MAFADLPETVPHGLRSEDFVLRPITADDAAADHAALMETRELLRLWEQSTWPADDFTVAANREDLTGLQERHEAHRAFTFTVVDPADSQCLGCVYLFPTDATFLTKATVSPVGDTAWDDVQAVVYFWVRQSRMQTGLDTRLLAALRAWLADEWRLRTAVFVTNEQFTQQVQLIEQTDLRLQFELVEPGKPGKYLVFG